jgi:hypothetical protein
MKEQLLSIVITIGPILILLISGMLLRTMHVIDPPHVQGLQILVLKVILPSALFLTFLDMRLHVNYILLPLFAFFLCAVTYAYGFAMRKKFREPPAFRYLMSSFEFGMMGITLFVAAFGQQQLGKIAIIGLGQEFFVWFVMVPSLSGLTGSRSNTTKVIKSFVTNPALVAIFAGLVLNISGFSRWGEDTLPARLLLSTLKSLSPALVPMILIIIGYNMDFKPRYMKQAAIIFLQRIIIMGPLTLLFIVFIMGPVLHLDRFFLYAVITLIILPPPFVIPLFLPQKREGEIPQINGVLMGYTLLTVVVFCLFVVIVNLQ